MKSNILAFIFLVSSVLFTDVYAVEETVLFDGELGDNWIAYQAHGGNYAAHAKLADGNLTIDVPDGAAWGKVGLLSNDPVLWLDNFGNGAQYTITVRIDPEQTTGMVIALTETGHGGIIGNDPPQPAASLSWIRKVDGSSANAVFSVDGKESWKVETPPGFPAEIRFVITPGKVSVKAENLPETASDWSVARPYEGIRMYVYSHVPAVNKATRLKLEKITSSFKAGEPLSEPKPADGVAKLPVQVLFAGDPGDLWEPFVWPGYKFEDFGKFENGQLTVDIPQYRGWAKVGLVSKSPLFKLDQSYDRAPLKLTFVVDPERTTGFRVAMDSAPQVDWWPHHSTWDSWVIDKEGIPGIYSHYSPYQSYGRPVSRYWSGRYVMILGPKWVISGPEEGPMIRRSSHAVDTNSPQYVSITSQPAGSSLPSTLVLEEILMQRLPPEGMTAAERWSLMPDDRFDAAGFTGALADELLQETAGEVTK